MPTLREQRTLASALLDASSPVDAPTAYYALYHDQARSALFVRGDRSDVRGFVGRFQTGIDLFRPLVTLRCQDAPTAADLMAEALIVGRPYILFCLMKQYIMVGGSLEINNERILSIYTLDRSHFKREINVLVTMGKTSQGMPRATIESNQQRAVAGVNWQSPGFAEVYVDVDPPARQKGWGRSVLVACSERVLADGRQPIYLVEPSNTASVRLAESAGFVDTGARQVLADAVYTGHPAR
jgi:hypothetical protein